MNLRQLSRKVGKGQGAMEYLMTYSWAILVVMIVGVALWQLGIFNIGGATGTSQSGFPRIKPLLSTGVYRAGTDEFSLTFTNGAGGTIEVREMDVYKTENTGVSGDACTFEPAKVRLGGTFTVTCHFSNTGDPEDQTQYIGEQGDPYVMNISITYTVTAAGQNIERTDSGVVRGPMEP